MLCVQDNEVMEQIGSILTTSAKPLTWLPEALHISCMLPAARAGQ
jgi:hypothetical protein